MNRRDAAGVRVDMRPRFAAACTALAATGVLLSAVVHLDQWSAGFRAVPVLGTLFLLNTIGGVVIATVAMVWRHWLPALAMAGFGTVTAVFFWISVVHGLFGVHERPGGGPEILAQVAEYVAIAFGLAAAVLLSGRRPELASLRRRRPTSPARA